LPAEIRIKPVATRRDRNIFVRLPWQIYSNDPNWVPPLLMDMHNTLNPKKNALLRLGPYCFMLAFKGDKPVGRIGVGLDERLNKAKQRKSGYMTLFESVEDYPTARALFDAGLAWLREKEAEEVTGPQSPSNGDDYRGLLIKGFDSPPVLLNSYNPRYYPQFFEQYGFEKDFDRYAYYYDLTNGLPERLQKGVEAVRRRYNFRVRPINLRALRREMLIIKDIVERSMPDWPDMIPPSMEEIEAEAMKLKQLAQPELVLFIESSEGEPIGLSIALPDYNQVLAHLNGRLFPFGIIKFFWYKRRIKGTRLFVLFVTPEWRKRGVSAALYYYTMLHAYRLGYTFGEGSTIHEFNKAMNLDARKAGGELYKIYRVYKKKL
jgi:GNAT superfamily N-acetyltransferase